MKRNAFYGNEAYYRDSVFTETILQSTLCLPQDLEQRTFINTKGCVPQFEKWLQENLTVVAGIFIGIALLQVRLREIE